MMIKSLDFKGFPYDHVFFFTWTSVSRSAGYKWIVVVWVGDDQLWRESCTPGASCHCNCYMFWLFEMSEKAPK
jgi:hypothetical protein